MPIRVLTGGTDNKDLTGGNQDPAGIHGTRATEDLIMLAETTLTELRATLPATTLTELRATLLAGGPVGLADRTHSTIRDTWTQVSNYGVNTEEAIFSRGEKRAHPGEKEKITNIYL